MDINLIACTIDPGGMWAAIAIRKPEGEEESLFSVDFIVEYLKLKGIKTGINRDAIEALVTILEYDKNLIVAAGKNAVDGKDGYIEYVIPVEDKKAKPVVAEDGSVDYLNSLEIAMVEEGELIARMVPPTKGEFGFNIYSEILKPVPGKPVSQLRGKGFVVSEDGLEYTASRAGHIYLDDDKLMIDPLYIVNGDLEVTHGNIKFNGDVEVRGDMRSGTRIEAEGSIFINGHVGSCELIAGGNITIGKGVQGKYNCEIVAGGDVAGSFMEHCNVTAGGSVYANSTLDCFVLARNSVKIMSKMACIIGGSINAMQMIQAKDVGNDSEIATNLAVGDLYVFRQEANEYRNRLNKVTKDFYIISEKLKAFDKVQPGGMTEELKELKKHLFQAKILRDAEKRELESKIKIYEEDVMKARREASVQVGGVIYPGVTIKSDNASYVTDTAFKEIVFRPWLGEIQLMSYDEYSSAITDGGSAPKT